MPATRDAHAAILGGVVDSAVRLGRGTDIARRRPLPHIIAHVRETLAVGSELTARLDLRLLGCASRLVAIAGEPQLGWICAISRCLSERTIVEALRCGEGPLRVGRKAPTLSCFQRKPAGVVDCVA